MLAKNISQLVGTVTNDLDDIKGKITDNNIGPLFGEYNLDGLPYHSND